VAAGVLSLSMAGQHESAPAQAAGNWLLAHPAGKLGDMKQERYFYYMYYTSQAAAQLGGRFWDGLYPPMVESLLDCQLPTGAWPPEPYAGGSFFGNCWTTALSVLSLTPPYQLLPIYQR
jgi:hypothetical protein